MVLFTNEKKIMTWSWWEPKKGCMRKRNLKLVVLCFVSHKKRKLYGKKFPNFTIEKGFWILTWEWTGHIKNTNKKHDFLFFFFFCQKILFLKPIIILQYFDNKLVQSTEIGTLNSVGWASCLGRGPKTS